MTIRHTLLAVGAVLVLGMALYLVREVSRTPPDAEAHGERGDPPPRTATPEAPPRREDPPTRATLPSPAAVRRPETPPDPGSPTLPTGDVPPPESADVRANPKLDLIMAEANRAYDGGDFDEAKQIAEKVLAKSPGNVRMLRIMVSTECIAGEATLAQKYYAQLPPQDRAQMRTRCDRYGVTLKDP